MYAHVSDVAEWDDYEWSWTGSLTEWALDNPGHPDAAEALTLAESTATSGCAGTATCWAS